MNLNQALFQYIFSFSGKSPLFDAFGVFLAEYLPYFLIFGIFFFITSHATWRKRGVISSFFLFNLALGNGVIGYTISFFFPTTRPFVIYQFVPLVGQAPNPSFPDQYAILFFSLAFVLLIFRRPWGVSYFLAAIAVSLGRIFVGVHWPLDVLGGFIIAAISLGISWLIFEPHVNKLIFQE